MARTKSEWLMTRRALRRHLMSTNQAAGVVLNTWLFEDWKVQLEKLKEYRAELKAFELENKTLTERVNVVTLQARNLQHNLEFVEEQYMVLDTESNMLRNRLRESQERVEELERQLYLAELQLAETESDEDIDTERKVQREHF